RLQQLVDGDLQVAVAIATAARVVEAIAHVGIGSVADAVAVGVAVGGVDPLCVLGEQWQTVAICVVAAVVAQVAEVPAIVGVEHPVAVVVGEAAEPVAPTSRAIGSIGTKRQSRQIGCRLLKLGSMAVIAPSEPWMSPL